MIAGAAARLPAGRAPLLLLPVVVLCALAECGAAAGSVLELVQYQPIPQYRTPPVYQTAPQYQLVPPYQPAPRYKTAPQYQVVPQYQRPLPVPQAPVYEPGPYDDYNHGNGP